MARQPKDNKRSLQPDAAPADMHPAKRDALAAIKASWRITNIADMFTEEAQKKLEQVPQNDDFFEQETLHLLRDLAALTATARLREEVRHDLKDRWSARIHGKPKGDPLKLGKKSVGKNENLRVDLREFIAKFKTRSEQRGEIRKAGDEELESGSDIAEAKLDKPTTMSTKKPGTSRGRDAGTSESQRLASSNGRKDKRKQGEISQPTTDEDEHAEGDNPTTPDPPLKKPKQTVTAAVPEEQHVLSEHPFTAINPSNTVTQPPPANDTPTQRGPTTTISSALRDITAELSAQITHNNGLASRISSYARGDAPIPIPTHLSPANKATYTALFMQHLLAISELDQAEIEVGQARMQRSGAYTFTGPGTIGDWEVRVREMEVEVEKRRRVVLGLSAQTVRLVGSAEMGGFRELYAMGTGGEEEEEEDEDEEEDDNEEREGQAKET